MGKIERVFAKVVVQWRWWIMVVTLLTVLTSASGLRFLTFNTDLRVFFSKENPQLHALEELENTYSEQKNIFLALAPKNKDVFTQRILSGIEDLTEAFWEMPHADRVDSITNFQYSRSDGDDFLVTDLVEDAKSFSKDDLEKIKHIALTEPLLVNRLVSPSGHVTGININVLPPGETLEEVPEIAAYARKIADDFRIKYSDIDVYLTGSIMFDNGFGEASQNDMSTLLPLMFFTLLAIIWIVLRSFAGTFATLIIVCISSVTGMGLAGWLGMSLTTASSIAPIIILTIAVADSIHVLVTIFQELQEGRSKHEAIVESLRINLQPVFLTSATTTIGFLTMNFSDAPPFRDLGNIVAMGVTAAFLYSVLFLPALMAILPLNTAQNKGTIQKCNRLADFVIKRRKLVFWSTLIFIILVTAGIMRIELNDDWVKYFSTRYDIRRSTDFVSDNLTGIERIEYSLESGKTDGIHDPAYLATVENFANWYRKQPKVIHVNSFTDIMKRLNKNMHEDDEAYYQVPDHRNLAAQYLLLYEMSLPSGLELTDTINSDRSATRMVVTLQYTNTKEQRELDKKARAWLKDNAPQAMFTYGSGMSIIWAHISKRNIKSMFGASFGALLLISVILIFALRSFKIGLLSIIPNIAPAVMAFGVWGLISGQVGLALSVIVSLTIGVVVDDTVHFLSKYLRARREHNLDASGAVRYSFNTVGTAMWVTTVSLVAGFTVLSFSGFKMNANMGIMTSITIMLALFMDFFFLPALLIKVDG